MKKSTNIIFQTVSHLILAILCVFGFLMSYFDVLNWGDQRNLALGLFGSFGVVFLLLIIERHIRLRIESKKLEEFRLK